MLWRYNPKPIQSQIVSSNKELEQDIVRIYYLNKIILNSYYTLKNSAILPGKFTGQRLCLPLLSAGERDSSCVPH